MLDDMLKIVLDPLFSEVENNNKVNGGMTKGVSMFPVDGYSDSDNMWTRIF